MAAQGRELVRTPELSKPRSRKAGRGGERRGGPEGSPKAAVSAMRKTFRGGIPEDQWSSGSLTSWRRDNSGDGNEHDEDGFAPPRYRVHLEDLDELHSAAWRGDVPGVERVLVPGGPGVDKRDNNRSHVELQIPVLEVGPGR
ncbi:putative coiled-coil domain-containing protein 144B [Aotus nancymaae]|uniref:putative coiled-coil domain-containing protein 144B n=1 Tax=Aotus nancymaae TaxID=37293 RepID=UPI0030FE41D2